MVSKEEIREARREWRRPMLAVLRERRGIKFPEDGPTGPRTADGPHSVRCAGCRCELDETCQG